MDRFELHHNFVHSQLQEQNARQNSVQSKATSFMTMSIGLIGVTGLILTGFTPHLEDLNFFFFWGCAISVGATLVLTVFFSMKASYVGSRWYIGPHPEEMQSQIADSGNTDTQIWTWTTNIMVEAFRLNEETLTGQAKDLSRAMFFFWAEVIFLMVLALNVITLQTYEGILSA